MRATLYATTFVSVAACNALFGVDTLQFGPAENTGGSSEGGAGASGATGGGGNTGEGGSGGPPTPWWDTSFPRRVRIDLATDRLGASGSVTNFPLLVRLDGLAIDLAGVTPSAGDLRFLAADNQTVLAHELESWKDQAGGLAWVRIPTLDLAATDEHVWLYYGNLDAAAQGESPWDDTFVTVHHFAAAQNDASSDSAGNVDASLVDGAQVGAGMLGDSLRLDGIDDYAALADDPELGINDGAVRTFSAWVLAEGSDEEFIWLKESGCSGWTLSVTTTGGVVGFLRATNTNCMSHVSFSVATSGVDVRDGAWHHFAFVVDRQVGIMRLYVDGVEAQATALMTTEDADAGAPFLGVNAFGLQSHLDGGLDELRIASDPRSAAWFALEHANGRGRLVAFGPDESL